MLASLESSVTAKKRGQVVGYLRVSTEEQSTVRQLEGFHLDRKFIDYASGKDTQRPELDQMMRYLRDGDTLLVHSMDRLARNVDDLRRIVLDLTKRGVRVDFKKESLIFTGDEDSAISNLLLSVLGAVAQFERDLIRERQREGIALAKKKGVYKGRKHRLTVDQAADVRRRLAAGESPTELGREYKVTRQTIYRARVER